MGFWSSIILLAGVGLLIWLTINTVRQHPKSFSASNLSKSFYTVGILTLIIIILIAFCIMILK